MNSKKWNKYIFMDFNGEDNIFSNYIKYIDISFSIYKLIMSFSPRVKN